MNRSTMLSVSAFSVCLLISSCKDSNKTTVQEPDTTMPESSREGKREALFKLMPSKNLDQLGTQTKEPLGGMYTTKDEFATYPFNLGPTGITALRTKAGDYTVASVTKGSPADGKLKQGDNIVGANGRYFYEDKDKFPDAERRFPNPQMGMAIEQAEANEGALTLMISQGKAGPENVAIQLQPLGAMGEDFPNKSLKAEFLAATQAEILLAHQNAEGGWGTGLMGSKKADSKTKIIPTCMCAIALMSADDEKYTPAIKKAFEVILKSKINSFHTWQYAYKSAFLTEYQLRYGDSRIKPAVQAMVDDLADGYFYYNGVYGYGHSLNGGNYRYGGINVCTAHACYTLAMGRILGCNMPNQIDVLMAKSLERLAPDGAMDYLWGAVRKGETPSKRNEDQCRTGIAAMAYYYLGGRPEQYQKFQTYLLKNKEHADGGHATGGTLSWASSGLAMAMADDASFEKYMQSKVWQLAFNRTWDYGYYLQPSPHGQHRGSDQALGGHYISAANTILFNRQKKNLIMTGMKKGIPEVKPSYTNEVLAASDYYERQSKITDVVEVFNIVKDQIPHALPIYLERMKEIPLEAPDYHKRMKELYANLPAIARQLANMSLTDEQRSAALSSLLGIKYSRSMKESRGKIHLYHHLTKANVGDLEIISEVVSGTNKPNIKRYEAEADLTKKLLKYTHRLPYTTDQDLKIKTKIIWNGLQIDLPYSYKKEDAKYLAQKEGIRGNWSKKPWELSYGPFYGTIKRTKTNGCLQVTYPDGTIFETALMKNALIHNGKSSSTLDQFLKKTKQSNIPDGTKIHFKYFHRGGNPALPMCDEIRIIVD